MQLAKRLANGRDFRDQMLHDDQVGKLLAKLKLQDVSLTHRHRTMDPNLTFGASALDAIPIASNLVLCS